MTRLFSVCCVTAVALLVCIPLTAQQTTEVYIPIGESPGLSGSESIKGTITEVEYGEHQMTVATGDSTEVIKITPATRYYIDKTSKKQRNEAGSFEDCETGLRIEAYVDNNGNAVWVKIAES